MVVWLKSAMCLGVCGLAVSLGSACGGSDDNDLKTVDRATGDAGRDARIDGPGEADAAAPDATPDASIDDAACDAGVSGSVFDLAARGSDDALSGSLYNSGNADISRDGRYVVFESNEPRFLSPAANGRRQILLRDRRMGTTTLVSARPDGTAASGESYAPAISNDGCLVVFESTANDLVANDAHSGGDVFLRNLCASPATTTILSVDTGGVAFTRASAAADISGDGHTVVFQSDHPQGTGDIYVHTVGETGSRAITQGNFASRAPAVSDDGARIAFWTFASNILPSDSNGVWDIAVYDRAGMSFRCASCSAAGALQQQGQEGASTVAAPAISGDGHKVAFRSRGAGLVGNAGGPSQVYVKDVDTGAIVVASANDDNVVGNGDSSGGGAGIAPSLSYDGHLVAFVSRAPNLLTGNPGASVGTVVRDLVVGSSTNYPGLTGDDAPVLSNDADGRYLAVFSNQSLDTRFKSSGVFVLDRAPAAVCTP